MLTAFVILFILCVAAVAHTYMIYPVSLLVMDRFRKTLPRAHAQTPRAMPMVSLIIAAYDEEKVIAERLHNALALNYPKHLLEIIIASDGSQDNTAKIVTSIAAVEPQIRFIAFEQRRGKVNVLNDVVPMAKGDFLVFSDANAHFHRNAINALLEGFAWIQAGCVCGRLVFQDSDRGDSKAEGFYWKLENWLKVREGRRGSLLGANGAIFALRREMWEPCPPDTLVEDFFTPMRLLLKGARVYYQPSALAVEETAPSVTDEFVRRVRIGAGGFQALSRLWPLLLPRHGFSSYAFLSHKVLRWLTPFFLLGALLSCLMLAVQGLEVFKFLFAVQLAFYATAWAGLIRRSASGKWNFLLAVPTQFTTMNAALFCGFLSWITGSQRVTWKRTRRMIESPPSCPP